MTAAGCTTFTTTHRVVYRVHNNAADVRAFTEIAFFTGFAEFNIHMFSVADFADGGAAFNVDHADFAGWQLNLSIITVFAAEYSVLTCGTYEFSASSGDHFDIMDADADGYILNFKAVTWLEFSLGAVHNNIADIKSVGEKDISLFSVGIAYKGDICGTVGVVFDAFYDSGHAVFVSLEVDDAVFALVAATEVAVGEVAFCVAAA